jgi:hypothetical protein
MERGEKEVAGMSVMDAVDDAVRLTEEAVDDARQLDAGLPTTRWTTPTTRRDDLPWMRRCR